MKLITNECDICKRTYKYTLLAGETERESVVNILNTDVCYACKKKIKKMIEDLKSSSQV